MKWALSDRKRWETTASGCCLLACIVIFPVFYRDFGEFAVGACSFLSGFGIVLAASAIRQRCAKSRRALFYLVVMLFFNIISVAAVLSNQFLRDQIRYFWRDLFGF